MAYRVDYSALDACLSSINSQVNTWSQQLQAVSAAVKTLESSGEIAGDGADSLRAYLGSAHDVILLSLSQLISMHMQNFLLYKYDYQSNIDTGLNTVIDESELYRIRMELQMQNRAAISIDEAVSYTLGTVSDIVSVSWKRVYGVDSAHTGLANYITDLDERILALESSHCAADFAETETLLRSTQAAVNELSQRSRSPDGSHFSGTPLKAETMSALIAANVQVEERSQAQAAALNAAIDNEGDRIRRMQEEAARQEAERAEREKKMKWVKWGVTGLCIVGSVAAIALTGGAATPLVVGGISAISGAAIAGTNNLADQYVETGDLSKTDWSSFGKDVLVGGVTGFVTGYAGAAVSGAVTSGLSNTALGSSLLNSSNALTRIGTGAVIGSTSQVGSGIVSRGAGAVATGLIEGDLNAEDVLGEMFDGKRIVTDAITGGASGGFVEYKQYKADMSVKDYNEVQNPVEHAAERGYELKSGKNGTLEYSGTDYIKTSPDGQEIIVEVEATGSRSKDFNKAWELAESKYGVSKSDYSNVTWQHMDDYNVRTNKFTLELVDRGAHQGIKHAGGCKQYEVFKGVKYK